MSHLFIYVDFFEFRKTFLLAVNGYSERVQKQLHCAVRWYAHRDNDKAAGGKDGDEGCVTEARESPAHGAYNSHLSPCVLNPFACNYILY